MKIFCSNCGTENKSTNIKCEYCGNIINEVEKIDNIDDIEEYIEEYKKMHSKPLTEEQKKAKQKATKTFFTVFVIIFLIMFLLPFLIVGVVFTSISSSFGSIEDKISSEYIEVQASLIEYTDLNSDGTFKGVYEYEVDGEKYTVTTNYASSVKSMFDEYATVKYDAENPENAIFCNDPGISIFGSIGFFMIAFVVVVIIVVIVIFIIIKRKDNSVKRV